MDSVMTGLPYFSHRAHSNNAIRLEKVFKGATTTMENKQISLDFLTQKH